jgi:outer membrane protein assembly factor BamB
MASCLAPGTPTRAQLGLVVGGTFTAPSKGEKPVSSFTLPAQTKDVNDAIDEFKRFVQHEAWEKAFKSLETITTKTATGFVERDDGVLVPSRLVVRSLLAGLPPAGKSAYRVFFDAQAQALWDKASGAAELTNLTNVVTNHLASSVGAAAADRLGDLYFERGDMDQAVAAWRTVLDYCPDSKLSKAQLWVKIATALARSGRVGELSEVKRALDGRFASETIEVGGERLTAGEYFAKLTADVKTETKQPTADSPDDIALPVSDEPLWQFRYASKSDPANPAQPFNIQDWNGRTRANDFLIPTATDNQRLYANVFGVEMAFDLATGKMLWRTARMQQLNFQQNRQGVLPERYAIVVAGDRTWSVTRDPQQLGQYPATFSLVAREAATGKEVFNSRRTMSTWNIMSTPYLVGGSFAPSASPSLNSSGNQVAGAAAGMTPLDYSKGFAGDIGRLSVNGTSAVAGSRMRLTDGGARQVGSIFTKTPVSVAGFKTQFEFQFTKPFADGMIFILQGDGPTGLGGWNNGRNGIAFTGISKSVGVKFDIYGPDANSTGLCLDGVRPSADTAVSLKGSKIDLKSGHVFRVDMTYDGEKLDVTITDTTTQASHKHSYEVDIPSHTNGPAAHVGFMASSGLLTAVHDVMNWTYTPIAPKKKAPRPTGGDMIYVAAARVNQSRELSLLILDAKDGKLQKSITLGTHVVDPNQVYTDRASAPSLLLSGDRVYVDTHAGALVSVEPRQGTIDWGILYESPPPQSGYYYYDYVLPKYGVSGPMSVAGLLFAKGMRSPRVLAVRADGPAMTWNRPVDRLAVLVGADSERLYMGGEELAAYSLNTQELLWSTRLPASAAWSAPVITKNRLYQFTSRGVYEVDKKTGKVEKLFRGADLDAMGGALWVTPQALVTVSNLAITAYPWPSAPTETGTNPASDSSKP